MSNLKLSLLKYFVVDNFVEVSNKPGYYETTVRQVRMQKGQDVEITLVPENPDSDITHLVICGRSNSELLGNGSKLHFNTNGLENGDVVTDVEVFAP